MMRVTLPFQRSSPLSASSELYPAAPGAPWSRQLVACFTVCAIPARDVVINFGKFKGSQMGTLPCSYLRWLIKEGSQHGLPAWGDYAKQVLQDPHYQDRLEWESLEKLTGRGGDMRRGGNAPTGNTSVKGRGGNALTGNTSVKGTMLALGWDLSDCDAWYQVNFSLLGTTLGGRIPRKKPQAASVSSPETGSAVSKPKPTISNLKSSSASPRSASRMSAMKASLTGGNASISKLKQPSPTSPSSVSRMATMKGSLTCVNPTISNFKQPSSASLTSASRISTTEASLMGRNPTNANLQQPSATSQTFSSRVSSTKASLMGQNPTIPNLKQPSSASSFPSSTSGMSTTKASLSGKLVPPSATATPKNLAGKSSTVNDAAYKQNLNVEPPSLSLREELHRRRLLRKDRSTSKSLNKLLSGTRKVQALFPGRESLLEKAKRQGR